MSKILSFFVWIVLSFNVFFSKSVCYFNLIWVGFLEVRFGVGGKITPPLHPYVENSLELC